MESKAADNSGTVDTETSSNEAHDNDRENENGSVDISVPESTLPERRYTKDQWEADDHKVSWRDLVISVADTNQVTNRRDGPRSRLKGIKRYDGKTAFIVPTSTIVTDTMRIIGIKLRLPSSRTMSKVQIANAFVLYAAKMEKMEKSGVEEDIDYAGNRVILRAKRYLNVLFGSVMKVKLATRGASLTKAQLQDKLSTDQEFHTGLLKE